jgi:hypothetical protein
MQRYKSFPEFYVFYLSEHSTAGCRRLHFVGNLLAIFALIMFVVTMNGLWILLAPALGYSCAWIGHYRFEHNKPATFNYPVYSFIGDWVMFKDILLGKVKI